MEPTPPIVPPEPVPPATPDLPPGQWKTTLHLLGLAGLLVPGANIVGPLVVWLIKKDQIPSLDPEGRKVVNFQLSYTLYIVAATVIAMTLSCLVVPMALPAAVGVAWLIFTIIGAVKVSNGVDYQFPYVIKLL